MLAYDLVRIFFAENDINNLSININLLKFNIHYPTLKLNQILIEMKKITK